MRPSFMLVPLGTTDRRTGLRVMHRVTVMGNADLSPTPFRGYATWLDEEPEVRSQTLCSFQWCSTAMNVPCSLIQVRPIAG
jgi:hypothetical protein